MTADQSTQTIHDKSLATDPHLSPGRLATGLLAVAMAILGLIMTSQLKSHYPFEHNFHDKIDSPILALELSSGVADLKQVLHTETPAEADPATDAGKAIASLRTNTHEDFFFIPLYTFFLWAFAVLFTDANHRNGYVRTFTFLVILVAAFDCVENIGILRALGASSLSPSTAQAICWPSRCKWGLFAVALLFTAWILVRSSVPLYSLPTRHLLALVYGAAGILMLIGLMEPHFVEVAIRLFALLAGINIVGLLGPYIQRTILRAREPVYVDDFCNRKARMEADVAVFPSTSSGA
jgi:hypothetical protein